MIDSIKEYKKYEGQIDGEGFMSDLAGCLVPLAISKVGNKKLVNDVIELVDKI